MDFLPTPEDRATFLRAIVKEYFKNYTCFSIETCKDRMTVRTTTTNPCYIEVEFQVTEDGQLLELAYELKGAYAVLLNTAEYTKLKKDATELRSFIENCIMAAAASRTLFSLRLNELKNIFSPNSFSF